MAQVTIALGPIHQSKPPIVSERSVPSKNSALATCCGVASGKAWTRRRVLAGMPGHANAGSEISRYLHLIQEGSLATCSSNSTCGKQKNSLPEFLQSLLGTLKPCSWQAERLWSESHSPWPSALGNPSFRAEISLRVQCGFRIFGLQSMSPYKNLTQPVDTHLTLFSLLALALFQWWPKKCRLFLGWSLAK